MFNSQTPFFPSESERGARKLGGNAFKGAFSQWSGSDLALGCTVPAESPPSSRLNRLSENTGPPLYPSFPLSVQTLSFLVVVKMDWKHKYKIHIAHIKAKFSQQGLWIILHPERRFADLLSHWCTTSDTIIFDLTSHPGGELKAETLETKHTGG